MKLSEMREKTVDELKQFVEESKKQLLNFRIQKSMHKLENTAEISKTKRLVAQAKTVIKEKRCQMPKKEKQGVVISDKMDKTVVVKVASYNPHPKYKKIIESNKNYKAHDEKNECGIGDTVRIIESKPISGSKRWVVESIVEKAK